ncbi:type II toxin-antitoxin system VapC family toxin [Rhizobium sp. TH2]|uniref:type II toxin-antitoxin system VapC family toxin n=1 Tax=Rhizobium sp. TH2 TaxID=2775403 RepID=UPI00215794E9|nr:type II toxin-antitoxin system VapC family toxin [Rhizobium sp. TH2]UVC10333.1 type II toxin-antitoxin system VapC family toxin [Rhizobium sp. TH2]
MIFVDTNVISETMTRTPEAKVLSWLTRHDAELALSTVVIAEIAFGIQRIRPEQRADRLEQRLLGWRQRFANRIFGLTEDAAVAYGEIMSVAERQGRRMSVQDGMIAAIALVNRGKLATRNVRDFETTGLELISPWDN